MKRFLLWGVVLISGLICLIVLFACASRDKALFSETGWQEAVDATRIRDLYAPHVSGGRFFAPWMNMPDKRFLDVLGWKLFPDTRYTREQKAFLPRVLPDTAQRLARAKGDFILWIGHNTFLVRVCGRYWLTDPIFSKRALLPARKTLPALTLAQLNTLVPAPNIIISHNHYDHLDKDSMTRLPRASRVFVPLGLKTFVEKMNKPHVREMDWWDQTDLGDGVKLVCLPAQHWSMRMGQGRNTTLWAAWLLITPETTFYFGGDSGYFKGFKETGRRFPGIDYAFMATTAYHPRWFMHYQHMDVPEAVRAFKDLGARYFIPTQWGTFHLGNEPPGMPGLDLNAYIKTRQMDPDRFRIMDIGEIMAIGSSRPQAEAPGS